MISESKWFFWMSYYRSWPIKYIFISCYAPQVFAILNFYHILKLKFKKFKTSFKAWFPESKWFFWMSNYRWYPMLIQFQFPLRGTSLCLFKLKSFDLEIWKRHLNHDFTNQNDSFGCHTIDSWPIIIHFQLTVTRHNQGMYFASKVYENIQPSNGRKGWLLGLLEAGGWLGKWWLVGEVMVG